MTSIDQLSEFIISREVKDALSAGLPIVALESSVFCQGLPLDTANETQRSIEEMVREHHAIPATISVLEGKVLIGTNETDRQRLFELRHKNDLKKIAERDIGIALALKESGGTTVSATCSLAHRAGIAVFATGGIGGVHRFMGPTIDISADLKSLASYPLMVVSAGVKCILDVEKTLEILESLSVPVISFRSPYFPNFFCTTRDIKSPRNIQEIDDIIALFNYRKKLAMREAVLIAQPVADDVALDTVWFEGFLRDALKDAEERSIKESAVTPFLLKRLAEETHQRTVHANISLLKANARLGALLAAKLAMKKRD